MTLRRKMGLQITAMIVGLLLISGASLLGIKGMQEDYGAALEGIQQLRQTYEVASHLGIAKAALQESSRPDVAAASAIAQVQRAITKFEATGAWPGEGAASYRQIGHELSEAMAELRMLRDAGGSPQAAATKVDAVYNEIRDTASKVKTRIEAIQAVAQARRRSTLTTLGMISAGVILAAVLLGMWQYSGVLRPLHRLTGAVRRVARGQFGVRILEGGMPSGDDNEFARLAADFNRMAEQLDGFYKNLEEKVAAKSKELIRSERLASVGYLAAGVAHEINNPLGIISGYSEYALNEIKTRGGIAVKGTGGDRSGGVATELDVESTLKVIRDEAFRCKDITSKLLSLARPGEPKRQRVDLAAAAESVVSAIGGLKHFKERTISVRAEAADPLVVDAVEGEMKQVIMNLLINALEATEDDGSGEVRVTLARGDGYPERHTVTLTVSDNGRGMSPETLEQVFEPFFTDRPRVPGSPPRPGTGLGLSITHAIIQSHGGRITAHSDGVGRGSWFVIELPAAHGAEEPA
jgi:signal transduction histidine kinase